MRKRSSIALWSIAITLTMLATIACSSATAPSEHSNGTLVPVATAAQPQSPTVAPSAALPAPSVAPPATPATVIPDAGELHAKAPDAALGPSAAGLPPGAAKIAGLELMQRLVGTWTGLNSNTPIGVDFPMTVEFAPSGDGLLFGMFNLDAQNNVLWGFNIETYAGKDVLAYRNGGYLGGVLRDSRTALVEHDSTRGYYRFCAVKERGLPADGCNYIDARYTFSAPDKMLFEVTTQSGRAHVHWEATRMTAGVLPDPFPASVVSQGDGSAPWPAAAGIH